MYVIQGAAPVDAQQVAAGGFVFEEIIAIFDAVIVAEIPEHLVPAAEVEIQAAHLRVVSVFADGGSEVVIGAVGSAGLIGKRVVVEIVFGDGAEAA